MRRSDRSQRRGVRSKGGRGAALGGKGASHREVLSRMAHVTHVTRKRSRWSSLLQVLGVMSTRLHPSFTTGFLKDKLSPLGCLRFGGGSKKNLGYSRARLCFTVITTRRGNRSTISPSKVLFFQILLTKTPSGAPRIDLSRT